MRWIALTDNQLPLSSPPLEPKRHPVNDTMKTRKAEAPEKQDLHMHQGTLAVGSAQTDRAEPHMSALLSSLLQNESNPGQ